MRIRKTEGRAGNRIEEDGKYIIKERMKKGKENRKKGK